MKSLHIIVIMIVILIKRLYKYHCHHSHDEKLTALRNCLLISVLLFSPSFFLFIKNQLIASFGKISNVLIITNSSLLLFEKYQIF